MQIQIRASLFLHFVLLLVLLGVVYRAYAPLRYRLSPKIFWRLLGLRSGALFLLVLAVLDPKWISRVELTEKTPLLLMIDASQSMDLPFESGVSRAEKMQAFLQEFSARGDSTFYQPIRQGFHRELVETESPEGSATDLLGCLSKIESRYSGNLTEVVLLSDGAQTLSSPMTRFPFRIHTIRICPEENQMLDVYAQRFLLPNRFFVQQPFQGKLLIRANTKQEIPLQVRITFGTESQQIQAVYQGEYLLLPFEWTPTQAGDFLVTAEIQGLPQEQDLQNNRLEKRIVVQQKGISLLYLENRFRLEQRWLLRTLGQMSAVQIDFRLQKNNASLPNPLNPYKVVVLGDLKISKEDETRVLEYVRQGGGLWLLGASKENIFLSALWKNLSPCEIEPLEWISREVFFYPEKSPTISILSEFPEKSPLPITRFLQVGRPKAMASTLLWIERFPLLSVMSSGLGRTALLATDSFYQLVYNAASDSLYQSSKQAYEQTLRQMILWLANQNETSETHLDLEKMQFALGEPILAQIHTETVGTFKGKIFNTSFQEEKLFLLQDETLQASFQPTVAGKYQLQVVGTHKNTSFFQQEVSIDVYEENLEKKIPPNPEFLKHLSQSTQGHSFPIQKGHELWKELESRGPVKVTKTLEKRFWDSSLYYFLFFLCLMLEWIQRKKVQLV